MTKIKLLPDEVINKIAAGEVVERPSSVVKELLENCVDAQATKIKVELVEGGTKSIVITDNGKGIRKEDLPMTVCRHATSKIESASDLFSIHTMGFRGEALAAISSVSRFTIKSRHMDETVGSMLVISNEIELKKPTILSYDGARGTVIMVEDLFYNVPARSKFLKRSATEYAHILELVQALSLIHPQIDFTLVHNGKEVFRAYEVDGADTSGLCEQSLRARARAIFKDDAENLIYIEDENEYGTIKGLISPPGIDRATNKHMFSFVNGRWVKDKAVRSGVFRGYHGHLLKGRNPLGVIVLNHDPSLVDVNAHPAKTEVRFQYPGEVGALIALAIRAGIRQGGWARSPEAQQTIGHQAPGFAPVSSNVTPNFNAQPSSHQSIQGSHSTVGTFPSRTSQSTNFGSGRGFSTPTNPGSSYTATKHSHSDASFGTEHSHSMTAESQVKTTIQSFGLDQFDEPHTHTSHENEVIPWNELRFIGTFAKCYLMFEGPREEFLVVDQHAFHERILFEKLTVDRSLLLQEQPLMIPELIELAPEQAAELEEAKDKLESMSFRYQKASDTSIEVTGVPTLLAGRNLNDVFNELSTKSWTESEVDSNAEVMEHILETIACHSAVRSGEILTDNEMTQMLAQARSVDFYHNCPNGRRVFRWFKKREIEKWFDRI